MNVKDLLQWLHERIHTYNLFISEEEEEEQSDESEDSAVIIKHQRYATRFYVPLFISK